MSPDDIATKEDINRLYEKINQLIAEIAKIKPAAVNNGQEVYLTSKEVIDIYKVSKSHLTDLRNEGKIPYSDPFGIYLYPKSAIEKIIMYHTHNEVKINN